MQMPHSVFASILRDLFSNKTGSTEKLASLDGDSLTIKQLLAVAKHAHPFDLDERQRSIVQKSQSALYEQALTRTVYGINTNFGANAATTISPDQVDSLHQALQGLLAGILLASNASSSGMGFADSTPAADIMPASWVRGAILLRANTFLRGHSGVSWALVEMLRDVLAHAITPVVPLQGSISASGDIAPLAYVAYMLAGHPGINVTVGHAADPVRDQLPCSDALQQAGLRPIRFKPKEVLAITNGTAVSASVAAHALHLGHSLLALTQILTAVHAEAMLGFGESFIQFLHDQARPHPGQVEVAGRLREWLSSSTMLQDNQAYRRSGTVQQDASETARSAQAMSPVQLLLWAVTGQRSDVASDAIGQEAGFFPKQDRYGTRTTPQWLGPVVEDFIAAHRTIEVELNSSTDNPLLNPDTGEKVHGGNFQASAVTNATEKTRDGLAYLGRLLFVQQSELLNASMSNGLEAGLAPLGGPSLDGGFKGIDIANASYLSELGYLANRVGHFCQSAEMHNQSVNSLALISARYTVQAAELMAKLIANTIYSTLQAIDLRLAFCEFLIRVRHWLQSSGLKMAALEHEALHAVTLAFVRHSYLDLDKRAHCAATAVLRILRKITESGAVLRVDVQATGGPQQIDLLSADANEADKEVALATFLAQEFTVAMTTYMNAPCLPQDKAGATHALSPSSLTAHLWRFVRQELGVAPYTGIRDFVREHDDAQPAPPLQDQGQGQGEARPASTRRQPKTIGAQLSTIYGAIMDGRLMRAMVDFWPDVEGQGDAAATASSS